jgi:CheY-like chemotaxis protein
MDGATLERVFETFTRGDSPRVRSRGGLGIGLGLVHALVTLHGGSVHARSPGHGRGSEFEVRLPLGAVVPAAPAPPADADAGRPRARHVLIIEDDRDARELMRLVLELDGHRVSTAADGAGGVREAGAAAPDIVLVDIGLPAMDGYEVARSIRKRLGAAVRIVALTGYGDPEARRRSRDAGFDEHVVKPVDPDELRRLLGR